MNLRKSILVINDNLILQVTRSKGSWARLGFKDLGGKYNMIERWEVYCERHGIDPEQLPELFKDFK